MDKTNITNTLGGNYHSLSANNMPEVPSSIQYEKGRENAAMLNPYVAIIESSCRVMCPENIVFNNTKIVPTRSKLPNLE